MNHIMVRTNDFLSQEIGDEILVYNLIEDRAFHLNKSLAAVYKCCHEQSNLEQIQKDVSAILKESVSKDFNHITVYVQDIDSNICLIGQVEDLDDETLILDSFGTRATLDRRHIMIAMENITRIDAGGIYEKNLQILFDRKEQI